MGARYEKLLLRAASCVGVLAVATFLRAQPPAGYYPPAGPAPYAAGAPAYGAPGGPAYPPPPYGSYPPAPAPYGPGMPVAGAAPMAGYAPAPPVGYPGYSPDGMAPGAGPIPGAGVPCPPPGNVPPSCEQSQPPYPNGFACFHDYEVDSCHAFNPPSYIAVDLLSLRTHFDSKDTAFTTSFKVPGTGGPGEVDFNNESWEFTPRITVQVFPFDEWGVSASWFRYNAPNQGYNFINSDPTQTVTSARPPLGPQISSPQNYTGYLAGLGLPFANSVQGGSPDNLSIQNTFNIQVADLEALRFIRMGAAYGTIGLGVRYAYISHSYSFSRVNNPNFPSIAGFPSTTDPFDGDADATLTGQLVDYEQVFYGYNYSGVGPKLSLSVTWPMDSPLQFFGKVGGSALLGSRQEKFYESFAQQAQLTDDEFAFNLNSGNAFVNQGTRTTFYCMPTAEAELGVSLQLFTSRVHPIARVSGIIQYWPQAGNSTDPSSDLVLFGVSATVGIEF